MVLDVFFEALNYETIEQKKAYEVAGLLGRFHLIFRIRIQSVVVTAMLLLKECVDALGSGPP